MEVYNPYSIVQVSEVLLDLTMRIGSKKAYVGRAIVANLVNTGLTAVVSVVLVDEWQELGVVSADANVISKEAVDFVRDWDDRFRIAHSYQIVVNEMRAFLSDASRWIEQIDLNETLPREEGVLRNDIFDSLAEPIVRRTKSFFSRLNEEAANVIPELAPAHRAFAQAALHPYILRAPFVFRAFSKPLGYAGDYEMVNQIVSNPKRGPNTYFQIVNATFLQTEVAQAHRNRIEILRDWLSRFGTLAQNRDKEFRILNVGCGPAIEVQQFIAGHPNVSNLSFDLIDFSKETLDWTRAALTGVSQLHRSQVRINYIHDSVHELLKRRVDQDTEPKIKYDAIYCAGLFDYLSDKVCNRLIRFFQSRLVSGGKILVTNVHDSNPVRPGMEHLLEWYLIHRNEKQMQNLLPAGVEMNSTYVDATGVNVFMEATSK